MNKHRGKSTDVMMEFSGMMMVNPIISWKGGIGGVGPLDFHDNN